jgi:hypothetical protein
MKSFSLFAVLMVAIAGCAAGTNDVSDGADSASDELNATSVLASTFESKGTTNDTLFHSITMRADHTFTATGGCPTNGTGPHCFAIIAIHGTWKTKTSGPQLGSPAGAAELELTDQLNQTTTYFYSLDSDQLSLSKTFNGRKSLFDRDVSHLPKLHSFDVCADKHDNSLGICPEDLPCVADGPNSTTERCLPPI